MFKTFLAVSWEGRGVKRNRSGDLKEEKRGKRAGRGILPAGI